MLNNLKTRKKEQGFTIIEVLIVLAIAGLILLVVFLAVPALQRSQRNSGRRSEASGIAAAANDFLTNGSGTVPSVVGNATSIINSAGISSKSNLGALTGAIVGVGPATGPCVAASMTATKLTLCTAAAVTFTPPRAGAGDGVVLATGAQCNGADTIQTGSTRQMAVVYTTETSSGYNLACINI